MKNHTEANRKQVACVLFKRTEVVNQIHPVLIDAVVNRQRFYSILILEPLFQALAKKCLCGFVVSKAIIVFGKFLLQASLNFIKIEDANYSQLKRG